MQIRDELEDFVKKLNEANFKRILKLKCPSFIHSYLFRFSATIYDSDEYVLKEGQTLITYECLDFLLCKYKSELKVDIYG